MDYFKLTGHKEDDDKQLQAAASLIQKGEVVAFPTETVYGLGANARDEDAINKVFAAKGRPADNPLIVHVATKEQLKELVTDLQPYVEKLIDTFSPGPLTYVLHDNGLCAKNVTAGLDTIAIRIPDHEIARALINESQLPIAAPSANLSGKPSPTLASHVADDLTNKIAAIVDGGKTGVGVESTVLDCTGDKPLILRHGGVTKEQLESLMAVDELTTEQETDDRQPKSPGLKYKHYAPDLPLILVKGDVKDIQDLIDEKRQAQKRIGLLATDATLSELDADLIRSLGKTTADVAQNLYGCLRDMSAEEIDYIVCESFEKHGVGKAIMDRLERAATRII